MKVRFRQSGGFVGALRGCEVETSSLEAGEARELERLVKSAGLEAGSAVPASTAAAGGSAGARDLRRYEIEVEGPGGPVRVVLDDRTVPPAAAPLLAYLKGRARPEPIA